MSYSKYGELKTKLENAKDQGADFITTNGYEQQLVTEDLKLIAPPSRVSGAPEADSTLGCIFTVCFGYLGSLFFPIWVTLLFASIVAHEAGFLMKSFAVFCGLFSAGVFAGSWCLLFAKQWFLRPWLVNSVTAANYGLALWIMHKFTGQTIVSFS